ncbi:MAG: hypothetical protein GXP49_12065 [Deltaproteobacteria bacterium]|nr:hypothetical protein [Deltaproteobacteria bacterium]
MEPMSIGVLTRPLVEGLVEKIITISKREIISAKRLIFEGMKLAAVTNNRFGY